MLAGIIHYSFHMPSRTSSICCYSTLGSCMRQASIALFGKVHNKVPSVWPWFPFQQRWGDTILRTVFPRFEALEGCACSPHPVCRVPLPPLHSQRLSAVCPTVGRARAIAHARQPWACQLECDPGLLCRRVAIVSPAVLIRVINVINNQGFN